MDVFESNLNVNETENFFGGSLVNDAGLLPNTIGLASEKDIGEINDIFDTITRKTRDVSDSNSSSSSNVNSTVIIIFAIVGIILLIGIYFLWKFLKKNNSVPEIKKNKYIGALDNLKQKFTVDSKKSNFNSQISSSLRSNDSN